MEGRNFNEYLMPLTVILFFTLGLVTGTLLKRRKNEGLVLLDIVSKSQFVKVTDIALRKTLEPINRLVFVGISLVLTFWMLYIVTLPISTYYEDTVFFPYVRE